MGLQRFNFLSENLTGGFDLNSFDNTSGTPASRCLSYQKL